MKLTWQRDPKPLYLCARMAYEHGAVTPTGLRDEHLEPVAAWCQENRCGVRTAFDQFRFRNEQEIAMFLLRWS
jgi:hypothetical protein